jgi:hypothetical protein
MIRQISACQLAIVAAAFLSVAVAGHCSAVAQEFTEPIESGQLMNLFGGGTYDLGNLTSTGNDGLQLTIEPSNPAQTGPAWRGYPYDSAVTSPAQSSFSLLAGAPLTVAIPQLTHLPQFADVSVSDTIVGNDITINATMQYGLVFGNTFYGIQEYLLPVGGLDAGNYCLTLNVTRTIEDIDGDGGVSPPTLETGFANFTVSPVPEPSTLALAMLAISGLGLMRFGRR